ncbi:MAG: ferric reductase-like transmembrane domain-containing protein [Roseomonas sp.]|nr:ferric reductase-like transmembrane domain-containing protein [Roseomonas sp.]MCA3290626.1 ferric reductase-like transmembrane domain-containing protein [Roseomonas sp.]MCA3295377.1 ferric reductase-like transmembrane domain-containing protein [Roseomonas sp.]
MILSAYALLVVLPVALGWWLIGPARPWLDEASSAIAMMATAALLLEFLLSGRFRVISAGIGMDRSLRWHQVFAQILTLAALLHPLFYLTPSGAASQRPDDPGAVLGLDAVSLITGTLAWLLLGLLTLTAIRRDDLPYRYETWRVSRGLGAALLAGFALHHAISAGRYSGAPALMAYWAFMLALALGSLVAVYLLRPWRLTRRPWRIAGLERVGDQLWSLTLEPDGHAGLSYRAGQFAWLRLDCSAFSVREHPFSIASAPSDGAALRFLIKEAGDFTRQIGALPIGARAYVDGPHGALCLEGRREPGIFMIAGGAGLAPMLSLLRQAAARGETRPIALLYGNRHQGQIMAAAELAALAGRLPLDLHHVLQEPPPGWTGFVGMMTPALIQAEAAQGAREGWVFLLCGPGPMIRAAHEGLAVLGVPRRRILEERFSVF